MSSLNFSSSIKIKDDNGKVIATYNMAEAVENDSKTQTIRRVNMKKFKVRDKLYMFSGLRAKKCKRLGIRICKKVEMISILSPDGKHLHISYVMDNYRDMPVMSIWSRNKMKDLAIADGFKRLKDMELFLLNTYPAIKKRWVTFRIIHW